MEEILEHEGAPRVPDVPGMSDADKREAYKHLSMQKWVEPTYYQGDFVMMQGTFLRVTDRGRAALQERLAATEDDRGTTAGWSVEERTANRERFLKALHSATGGSTGQPVDSEAVAGRLGFSALQARGLRNDLRGRGLVRQLNTSGAIVLTAEGVDAVERLLHPPPPAPPMASIAVGDNASNVVIQSGSNNTAAPTTAPNDVAITTRAIRFIGGHAWQFALGVAASLVATVIAIHYLSDTEPVTLRIVNEVTNGATNMREDDQPLWLSSHPDNACAADDRCSIPAPDLVTGTHVTADCDAIASEPMTNGMVDDPVDDDNPGLRSSRRWFGIRYRDKRYFVNEVFVEIIGGDVASLRSCEEAK
jgi:hypothetical protein